MIKIAHIQKVKSIAGSENHLLQLLPHLQKRGFDPVMLVLADREDQPDAFVDTMLKKGVEAFVVPLRYDIDPLLIPRLCSILRTQKFQVVHTHLFHADFYGTLAARLTRVACCFSSKHGYAERRDNKWWVAAIDRMLASQQNWIITISDSLREWLHENEGLPFQKMSTVYYGFDCPPPAASRSRESRPEKIIGTVGRLVPSKKFDVLIRAMPAVLQRVPHARLWIVGDGPEREPLTALAGTAGLADKIKLLGYRADVLQLMEQFTAFAFPSVKEGFGMVLLEAMSRALPVVACRASSMPEIVEHGKTGLLVTPDDPEAMAQGLISVLENNELCSALGTAGRRRVEDYFTVEKMGDSMCEIYHKHIRACRKPA